MQKAWNKEGKYFGQSYEETDVLDSAVLIMPLVFFMHGVRTRFSILRRPRLTARVRSPTRGSSLR